MYLQVCPRVSNASKLRAFSRRILELLPEEVATANTSTNSGPSYEKLRAAMLLQLDLSLTDCPLTNVFLYTN